MATTAAAPGPGSPGAFTVSAVLVAAAEPASAGTGPRSRFVRPATAISTPAAAIGRFIASVVTALEV